MSAPRIRQYQHGKPIYSKRHTEDEWDKHKELLQTLHDQHVPRRVMLDTLNNDGFYPSMGQLVSKMKQWDLMVLGQRKTSLQSPISILADPRRTPSGLSSPESASSESTDMGDIAFAKGSVTSCLSEDDHVCHPLQEGHLLHLDLPVKVVMQPTSHPASTSTSTSTGIPLPRPKERRLKLNTKFLGESSDVPDLTHFGSDIASADSSTGFGPGEIDRAFDLANDNVHIMTDPYSTPTHAPYENDPLFGYDFDPYAPPTQTDDPFQTGSSKHASSNFISRTHYCCLTFFTNGAVGKSSPALYWHLLDECRSTRSLKYALALIFVWGTSPAISLQNDARYRSLIRAAAEQYVPLTRRKDATNEYLDHISARIVGIYTSLFEEPLYLDDEGAAFVVGSSKALPTLSMEDRRRDLLSYQARANIMPSVNDAEDISDDTTILHIAVEAREVFTSKMDFIVEYIQDRRASVSEPDVAGAEELLTSHSAWVLASKLSKLLLDVESFSSRASNLIGSKKISLDIVAEALSLVMADNICTQLLDVETVLHEKEAIIESSLDQLPQRIWPVTPIVQAVLIAIKMRIGLVEAARLCDKTRLFSDQHEPWSALLRSCRGNDLCTLLDSDITVFDKQRGAEDISASPTLWPQRSTSILSTTSFSKLKDIAKQIYLRGNGNSINSVLSAWSGHASSRSWRLEDTMHVEEIPLETILTEEDRTALDERAFEQMQDIEMT